MAVGGILLWGMNTIMPKIYNITDMLKSMLKNLKISDEGVKSVESLITSNAGKFVFLNLNDDSSIKTCH